MTLLRTDRPEEAVAHLRNVKLECGPLDSHYHSALGAAYWKLDKLPEALEGFEASLELDPEETSALRHRSSPCRSATAKSTGDTSEGPGI